MAARAASASVVGNPRLWYGVFGLLVALPVAVFAIGGVASDTWSLEGPAGPAIAFSAGLLSFVSPCVLPVVPIYIAQLAGASATAGGAPRGHTFRHALAFVSGFSIIFVVLGVAVGLLGTFFFRDHARELEQAAGVLLIAMGILLIPEAGRGSPARAALALVILAVLYVLLADLVAVRDDRRGLIELGIVLLAAWLRFAGYLPLNFFSRTVQVDLSRGRKTGYVRSALVGGSFVLGWTPCIGPVLTGIYALAGESSASQSSPWVGTYLLASYAAGLAIPFLLTGLAYSDATTFFRKLQRHSHWIEAVSAVMLVSVGIILWYGRLTGLQGYFDFVDFNQGL
jgi:cytochrome c-type biogenesis protein